MGRKTLAPMAANNLQAIAVARAWGRCAAKADKSRICLPKKGAVIA
jgi:hypothetical protein